MTGWGADTVAKVTDKETAERSTPTPSTLAEVAAAAQRWQLTQLRDALKAHPDLAQEVYVALKLSP